MIPVKDIKWIKSEPSFTDYSIEHPVENGIIGNLIFIISRQGDRYFLKIPHNSSDNWSDANIESLKETAREYVHDLVYSLIIDQKIEEEKRTKSMQNTLDWLKTAEGEKSIEEFFDKIESENKLLLQKKEQYDVLSDDDFKNKVIEESKKHGEEWKDKCYKEGCEPYPQEELSDIINIMLEYGIDYEPKEWGMFESVHRTYKGLRVVRLDGQGSFFRIFDKEELLIQT